MINMAEEKEIRFDVDGIIKLVSSARGVGLKDMYLNEEGRGRARIRGYVCRRKEGEWLCTHKDVEVIIEKDALIIRGYE